MKKQLTKPEVEILIRVLALTDCLFEVPRRYGSASHTIPLEVWQAIAERRRKFFVDGVELMMRGSAEQRKKGERRIGELQSAGYLEIASRSGRRCGCRLTSRGDDTARYFSAEPLLWESWPTLQRLKMLLDAGLWCSYFSKTKWVRETDLARCNYGAPDTTSKICDLEFLLRPLKAAGTVTDAPDMDARIWYSVTPQGEAALASDPPAPPDDLPKYQNCWAEIHDELLKDFSERRLTWRPQTPSDFPQLMPVHVNADQTWRDLELELPADAALPEASA